MLNQLRLDVAVLLGHKSLLHWQERLKRWQCRIQRRCQDQHQRHYSPVTASEKGSVAGTVHCIPTQIAPCFAISCGISTTCEPTPCHSAQSTYPCWPRRMGWLQVSTHMKCQASTPWPYKSSSLPPCMQTGSLSSSLEVLEISSTRASHTCAHAITSTPTQNQPTGAYSQL